jgi:hypothetical protein
VPPRRTGGRPTATDRALEEGATAIEKGDVEIEELADLDVALVRVLGVEGERRFSVAGRRVLLLHPFALHTATPMARMIVIDRDGLVYYDRYETWVRYVSRELPKRRDLTPLAAALSERSSGGGTWEADGPGAIVPALLSPRSLARSSHDAVLAEILEYVATAPVAWDPFAGSPG